MFEIRRADERGRTKMGWLDSRHSFSFGHYYDPQHQGYHALRVINDDRITPGAGFGEHPHANMEIISYVVEGALAHRDSLGTGSTIEAGDVQRMTAGTGIRHSEFNASDEAACRFLQIWVIPKRRGLEPGYEQRRFPRAERTGRFVTLASPDGADGSLTVHQDMRMAGAILDDSPLRYELAANRHGWLQVVRGELTANGERLGEGDGVAFADVDALELIGDGAEVLVFDLA